LKTGCVNAFHCPSAEKAMQGEPFRPAMKLATKTRF
jgi:hypothetical protein